MSLAPISSSPTSPRGDALAGRVVQEVEAKVSKAQAAIAPAANVQIPAAPNGGLAEAVNAAAKTAAMRQGGLAPLMADLTQALQHTDLPEPVQAAGAKLLALQSPLDPAPTEGELKQALGNSGLLLETQLAGAGSPPEGDLKAALLVFRQVLQTWMDNSPSQAPPSPVAVKPPPPPYPGAPVVAQPPASATLPSGADPSAAGHQLLHQASAALAHQELLQIASLPPQSHGGAGQRTMVHRWLFEVPFQSPQGAAIAQFEISRDGGGGGAAADLAQTWRARFSLDVEPMGPVHAEVALTGERAGVTVWAERGPSADLLRAQQTALTTALIGADLSPQVMIRTGAPNRPQAPAGQFVDQAS